MLKASSVVSSSSNNASTMNGTSASRSKKPIIVVPASVTSLLNLYNIKSFLKDQKFTSVEEVRKSNPSKPQHVSLEYGGITYRIVDSVHRFQKADWDNVVAVIVQGPLWQFKDWKWNSPVEIFTNVKGFFIHYEDAPIDPTIKGWDIVRLPIGRNKRHLDKQAVFQFWEALVGRQ